jgi:hypothetical protein
VRWLILAAICLCTGIEAVDNVDAGKSTECISSANATEVRCLQAVGPETLLQP